MASAPLVLTAEQRLALIRTKIERANKHIADLDREAGIFLSSNPYEITTKRNPQTRQLIYYLTRVDPIPTQLTAIVGDVVQNLRSALDHLAQQLWLVNNPGATSAGDVYFPTDSSAAQFKANAPGKIKGLRQDAIDAIYRIEPYDGGQGGDLSVLNRLNRIDKHQKVFQKLWPGETSPKIDYWVRPADNGPLKVGSELVVLGPDAEFDKDVKFKIAIALDEPGIVERKPLMVTLKHFADLVGNTVTLFKPCLS